MIDNFALIISTFIHFYLVFLWICCYPSICVLLWEIIIGYWNMSGIYFTKSPVWLFPTNYPPPPLLPLSSACSSHSLSLSLCTIFIINHLHYRRRKMYAYFWNNESLRIFWVYWDFQRKFWWIVDILCSEHWIIFLKLYGPFTHNIQYVVSNAH